MVCSLLSVKSLLIENESTKVKRALNEENEDRELNQFDLHSLPLNEMKLTFNSS